MSGRHEKGGNNGNKSSFSHAWNQMARTKSTPQRVEGGNPHAGPHGWVDTSSSSAAAPLPYHWEHFLSPNNQKVFNGTSVVDFIFWAQDFQMEATAAGVWDMFAPPDGAINAMTAALNGTPGALAPQAIIGALVEDLFISIVPPNATYTLARNIMDQKQRNLSEFYQGRLIRINDNALELPQAEVYKKVDQCQKDWETKKFEIEESEEKIYGELISAVASYDKVKNEHGVRKGKAMKLMQDRLGPAPKSIVRDDLMHGNFRAAFLTLYMHYNSGIGGTQNSIDMLKLIQNIEWEPSKMSIIEHIEKLRGLIAMCRDLGHSINEKTECAYVVASLQKAGNRDFAKDLEEAERQDQSLSWLTNRVARTASNLAMKGVRKPKKGRYDLTDPREAEAEFAGLSLASPPKKLKGNQFGNYGITRNEYLAYMAKQNECNSCPSGAHNTACLASAPTNQKSFKCGKCGKQGHKADSCWSEEVCDICGQMGHITEVHDLFTRKIANSKGNQKRTVSFAKVAVKVGK